MATSQGYAVHGTSQTVFCTLADYQGFAAQGVPIKPGTVVMDSSTTPNTFLGISDGLGGFGFTGGLTTAQAAAALSLSAPAAVMEGRGDSITVGVGVSSPNLTYGFLDTTTLQLPYTNYGVSSTGVLTQYQGMVGGSRTPNQTNTRLTLWLAMFNDMRSGNTSGRLSAARGVLAVGMLLTLSNYYGLRQYYNGNGSNSAYGAPSSSFQLSGSWGISGYGLTNYWRGVSSSTNNNTITATVQGSVVYVAYDRNKVNTGGTFSVSIDGSVVIPSVSCNGTGLGLENSIDQPVADGATFGYPTLLRIPTTPGKHSVVITVTSATSASNYVQIECIAGNDDCSAGHSLVLMGCLRMNAAGYLGSPAAYASQAIGDAAVRQYQQIQMELVGQFQKDGFNCYYADTSAYDPTIAAQVNADNIHPTAIGQALIAPSAISAYVGTKKRVTESSIGDLQTPSVPASLSPYQNTTQFNQLVFISGGTVTLVEFSRDGTNWISAASLSPAFLILSPSDQMRITYSVAPVLSVAFV